MAYTHTVASVYVVERVFTEQELRKFSWAVVLETVSGGFHTVIEENMENFWKLCDMYPHNGIVMGRVRTSYQFPLGQWECPGSPWGRCIYDNEMDGAHDNCLVCHEPDERK